MKKHVIGIDIGGTKSEAILVQISSTSTHKTEYQFCLGQKSYFLEVLARNRVPTNRQQGYQTFIEQMAGLIGQLVQEAHLNLKDIQAIGAGLPGSTDPQSGKMIKGNSLIFKDKEILQDLSKQLKIPPPILKHDNDANLFALAETLMGAGLKHSQQYDLAVHQLIGVGIILGTGVGGGIVINSQPLVGARGAGGEIGHTNHIPQGHSCYCGSRGCVEQYLSGPALEASFNKRLYSQIKSRPTSKEIFELAGQSEPLAIAVVKEYQDELAKFLAQLTNIFDPHFFVLGGGLSNQDVLYEGLEKRVLQQCFVSQGKLSIYKNQLGDSAGVFGAALRAFSEIP